MVWADADDTPGRAAGAVPACPGSGDAARASGAVRGADRRLRAHRRSPRVGAQRVGARHRRARPVVRARTAAGGRPRRQRLRRGTRPGGAHRANSVRRAARRPLVAGGRGAGAGAGARRGYVPSLACGRCRAIARCRHCTGPLSLQERGPGAVCRWCGRAEPTLRCARCGSDAVRAVVVGARRTAEELGRAFAGTPVITSAGDAIVAEVAARPALVVATPGAEPRAEGGYGAALLLDTWALLGRQDLRAAEDALWRWMSAAALVRARGDGGVVMVVAESSIPTVQSLIRWDPVGPRGGRADGSSRGRPAAQRAHGGYRRRAEPCAALLDEARLPEGADLLGPVDLPAGVRRPAGTPAGVAVTRMLVRVPPRAGPGAGGRLRRGVARAQCPPNARAGAGADRSAAHRVASRRASSQRDGLSGRIPPP